MGLFMIIVLGESVIAVVRAVADIEWEGARIAVAFAGLAMAIGIWWIYFEYVDRFIMNRFLGAGIPYVFGHLPIYLGLVVLSAGIENNIIRDPHIPEKAIRAAWCGGMLLFIGPMMYFETIRLAGKKCFPVILPETILLVTLMGLMICGGWIGQFAFTVLICVMFVIFVIQKLRLQTVEEAVVVPQSPATAVQAEKEPNKVCC